MRAQPDDRKYDNADSDVPGMQSCRHQVKEKWTACACGSEKSKPRPGSSCSLYSAVYSTPLRMRKEIPGTAAHHNKSAAPALASAGQRQFKVRFHGKCSASESALTRLHCAISSRRSGSRLSAPYHSINFCFAYRPERPHFSHDSRTRSPGYSHKLKRAVHIAVSSTLPTNLLADSLRAPSLASCSSNASAMPSVTSRDHPSAMLKATTCTGLE